MICMNARDENISINIIVIYFYGKLDTKSQNVLLILGWSHHKIGDLIRSNPSPRNTTTDITIYHPSITYQPGT